LLADYSAYLAVSTCQWSQIIILLGNRCMPGFYSRPIMLDGVVEIKDSVLSTGWNPVSKIVGFISEDEQSILQFKN